MAEVGEDKLLVHDEHRDDPSLAFSLSRLADGPTQPTPLGIFRSGRRARCTATEWRRSCALAAEKQGPGDLEKLLITGDTWTVD